MGYHDGLQAVVMVVVVVVVVMVCVCGGGGGGGGGVILSMYPANEGRCHNVTSSLIGWAHTQCKEVFLWDLDFYAPNNSSLVQNHYKDGIVNKHNHFYICIYFCRQIGAVYNDWFLDRCGSPMTTMFRLTCSIGFKNNIDR